MSHFEFLSGAVNVSCACPAHLRDGLSPFYQHPNSERWDSPHSRILYHETIHFWQVLSSGYLANLVAAEWLRFGAYQQSGEITSPAPAVVAFREPSQHGFSAWELSECWARFWDVHTRNPLQVMEDELGPKGDQTSRDLGADDGGHDSDDHDAGYAPPYSGSAWDEVMQRGVEHSTYEAPYRWTLSVFRRSPAVREALAARGIDADADAELVRGVASYLSVLAFPTAVHAAFGSPDPVEVYCGCIERIAASPEITTEILANKGQIINFDWLNAWAFLNGEVTGPVLRERRMPDFTPGLDVIDRGPLGTHPTYAAYLRRWSLLELMIKRERDAFSEKMAELPYDRFGTGAPDDPLLRNAITALAADQPWAVLAHPGQPSYRMLLGSAMAPPVVRFEDAELFPIIDLSDGDDSDEAGRRRMDQITAGWREATSSLADDLQRFRNAEYAVSLNLPANAFDRA